MQQTRQQQKAAGRATSAAVPACAAPIRALQHQTACCLQATPQVPDLPTAVSELVSNSLDSGAKRICVHLLALGPRQLAFAVEDDGGGILAASFEQLAVAGCTSKMRGAAELDRGVGSLGFKVCAGQEARVGECLTACSSAKTTALNAHHSPIIILMCR